MNLCTPYVPTCIYTHDAYPCYCVTGILSCIVIYCIYLHHCDFKPLFISAKSDFTVCVCWYTITATSCTCIFNILVIILPSMEMWLVTYFYSPLLLAIYMWMRCHFKGHILRYSGRCSLKHWHLYTMVHIIIYTCIFNTSWLVECFSLSWGNLYWYKSPLKLPLSFFMN